MRLLQKRLSKPGYGANAIWTGKAVVANRVFKNIF